MELLEKGIDFIFGVITKNKAAKNFKDDFVTATVNWVRPWFIEEDPSTAAVLNMEGAEDAKKAVIAAKMQKLMENESFVKELEAWLTKAKDTNNHSNRTIADNINVEVKKDIHIGNKTAKDNSENIAKDSKFKSTEGGFHLGDG